MMSQTEILKGIIIPIIIGIIFVTIAMIILILRGKDVSIDYFLYLLYIYFSTYITWYLIIFCIQNGYPQYLALIILYLLACYFFTQNYSNHIPSSKEK